MNASPAAAGPRRWAILTPFAVRSFRFQWPADMLTSWAIEMETLILGWYILVETGSVFYLTLFGSLQFLGTLLAPFFGVAGDRLGRRTMLCFMRTTLALLAALIMTLALLDALSPFVVLPIALMTGLVRPSDMVMRNSLIADTMPAASLMNALGLNRMTMDTARIIGALVGAGLFAALGIGPAYIVVTAFYTTSLLLTLGVSRVKPSDESDATDADAPVRSAWESRWHDFRDGLAYVRKTPAVLGLMWLAFLVNLTAFPLSHALLAYVAKEIYLIDETGLSHLVAGFASGALVGSVILASTAGQGRSMRFSVVNILLWYALIGVFAHTKSPTVGIPVLFLMGIAHSLGMITMSGVLLRACDPRFRGRVMGVRMLAVYGLPLGLMASSPLIENFGYPATASVYVSIGILFATLIAWRWRRSMWL